MKSCTGSLELEFFYSVRAGGRVYHRKFYRLNIRNQRQKFSSPESELAR